MNYDELMIALLCERQTGMPRWRLTSPPRTWQPPGVPGRIQSDPEAQKHRDDLLAALIAARP